MANAWHIKRLLESYYARRKALFFSNAGWDKEQEIDEIYAKAMQLQCKKSFGGIYYLEDFIEEVYGWGVCDYDGSGWFINDDGEQIEGIICDVNWLNKHSGEYEYIVWYNK